VRLPLAEVLMVAISQMVSMVPEGLPVAMTIALAVGMQRMAARGAIIRRLSAVETLGSTTVICSDKTGTLTPQRDDGGGAVAAAGRPPAAARTHEVSGSGYAPEGGFSEQRPAAAAAQTRRCRPCCRPRRCATTPNCCRPATSGAGRCWATRPKARCWCWPPRPGWTWRRCAAAPRAGRAALRLRPQADGHRHRLPRRPRGVWVKGAPEAVLRLCHGRHGAPVAQEMAREAAEAAMARQALRVLAFAEVDDDALGCPDAGFDAWPAARGCSAWSARSTRRATRSSVAPWPSAAAPASAPVMVTGDHKLTGPGDRRELGIAPARRRPRRRRPRARAHGRGRTARRPAGIAVFARVQPAQKLRIVEALQARGEVVAMTGDGVNDAPALARADVGVAMGITGTEVAKSAAKIVVTDDNFATIVGAVEQGRVVYGNLKKVILYLFATSIDEVLVLLLALLAGLPLPLARCRSCGSTSSPKAR
jgi:hypothetical protein